MADVLNAESLASLVTSVTATMCDVKFNPWDPMARGESLAGKMVLLPLEGERKISIVLAYDVRGGRALASKLFRLAPDQLSSDLIDDAVRELLNMVAGQVSRSLKIDQRLGLPRPTNMAEIAAEGGPGAADSVLLRSEGQADLRLWIFERVEHQVGGPVPGRIPVGKRVKLLVKRLVAGG
jgi:chemotaxis phosphatase CheX-like protein